MRRVTTALVAVLVVGLLATATVVGVRWWQDRGRTAFEEATAYAPSDAERLSWTDWAAVRDDVGASVGAGSSASDVEGFLDDAFDDDVTSASALVQSAPVLQDHFGFSPASIEWELFSQSGSGAVVIMRLPEGVGVEDVADHLEKSGFDEPSSDDGVWTGGETLLPEIGANLTPELQYVALDADERLVLTSDRADYLEWVVDDLDDGGPPAAMREVVTASGRPLSAAVYDGDRACRALAMSQAGPDDRDTADRLLADAGDVDPMTAFAMSVQPGGGVRVVMGFADDDQAEANAATRATLASGPAPGQGGDFSDRFTVDSATAEGDLVTLDLTPVEGSYVFSDLSTGPVLFATC
ncbi:hypothetical protein [Nocardioides sp. YIM 152315]|uniref:hypothetical protein n=1 Tax=Nocardioides sp. YIM 152315 TaxID=3031760 RepID=UPI0023DBD655|nr:hypothetical protein [Nocardioides sp. YIM 152315]MDF1605024.1 hypothetical protein [Nocardioides sp. YIM 152315]